MEYQEAFHPRVTHDQVEVILRTGRHFISEIVVLRDRAAYHDSPALGQPGECVVQDLTADVVEVHVDSLGAVARPRLAYFLVLIIDSGVEAGYLREPLALLASARDSD